MNKLKGMRLFAGILLAVTLLVGLAPAALAAGEIMTMDELYVSIMPEYDAMNVIMNASGNFTNDTGQPFQGEIKWVMPKDGKVFMVCETEKGMVCREYVIDSSNPQYDLVVWKPSRDIQPGEKFPVMFEYTSNNFTAPGERKFTVPFQSAFPINKLTVEYKQPKNASNLVLSPASTQTSQDSEGFTNYYYSYEKVKPQDQLKYEISYTRNETKPSKEPAQANAGQDQAAGTGSGLNPAVVALLVAFIAILGLFMYFAMRGGSTKTPARNVRQGGTKSRPANRQAAGHAPSSEPKARQAKANRGQAVQDEKKKVRKMLLDGKISEATYRQLIAEIEEEN